MPVFLSDLAARAVPRYTSYPTAAEFHDGVGHVDQAAAIAAIAPDARISLYLHIPYCHEICWYCGCNTGPVGRPGRIDVYVEALLREIALVAAQCRGTVARVNFGGGSPNALSPQAFARVADGITRHFRMADDAEWAVEIDPRHLTRDHALAFADAGVTRASLGAQTFDLHVQARINRIQPYRQVAQAVADLRGAGVARINLDLMYGLPDQTLDSMAATIAQADWLAPDRIALFGYAHLPRLIRRQRLIEDTALPDVEARFWQNALAHEMLLEHGYQQIGFDHFAHPDDSLAVVARDGRLRRNFQGFTDDPSETLIGLGASAISQFAGAIVQNEKHVGRYRLMVANDRLPGMRGVARSAEDRLRAAVIERILCDGEADVAAIERAHGQAPRLMAGARPVLAELRRRGCVEFGESGLALTQLGRPYARLVAAAFDAFRDASVGSFSRAV